MFRIFLLVLTTWAAGSLLISPTAWGFAFLLGPAVAFRLVLLRVQNKPAGL